MVLHRQECNPLDALQPLMTREDLEALQKTVADTFVSDSVVQYIVDLIAATRGSDEILRGASPRATLAVASLSKAVARLRGRDYVVPGDVREVFDHAVSHRIVLSSRAESQHKCAEQILREILDSTPIPKLR